MLRTDGPTTIRLEDEFAALRFLADRTPETTEDEAAGAFAEVAGYRDGGVFIGHYRGTSQWERHRVGDEIVMAIEGATTIFLWIDGEERAHPLSSGEMIVVPQGVWHRFETPEAVKILTVTPQPTDHRAGRPDD